MKNISNAFKRALFYNKRDYIAYADITLVDGTILHLTNDEIWQGGYSREEAISQDENFTLLGSAIINPATLIINNIKDKFSEYVFEKATVQLSEAMAFTDETPTRIETLYAGVYTVEDTKYNGATIKLSLVDNMSKFDRPYSESNLSYPATCDDIIRNACSVCGVTLQTFESALKNLSITNPPEKEAITFREVISWVATICGCYAKCDTRGRLELKWVDRTLLQQTLDSIDGGEFDAGTPYYTTGVSLNGGTFNPWNTGDVYDGGDFAELDNIAIIKGLSLQDICIDDTVIAGVRILIKDKTADSSQDILSYVYPSDYTEGFIVEVSDNEFITTNNVQTILTHLGTLLYGMTFRKLNVTQLSDPSIEAGDIGLVIDRKQHAFAIIVTRCTFKIGARQTIVCGSESALNNSSTRFSQATKTFLETKAMMNVERNERILALQQLSNALNSKAGLYTTVEPTASGAIFYMHDLPNLSESKVVWKMTDEAWGVTTNYNGAHPEQTVWNAGMTVDGNTIVRLLSAVGISADWINAGKIEIKDDNDNVIFLADINNKIVRIGALEQAISTANAALSAVEDKLSIVLTDDYKTIVTNADGTIASFPECKTFYRVYFNGTDVTESNDVQLQMFLKTGVQYAYDYGPLYYLQITGLPNMDFGFLAIRATYKGLVAEKRYYVYKRKVGGSTNYGLDVTPMKSVIGEGAVYSPDIITADAYSTTDNGTTKTAYLGDISVDIRVGEDTWYEDVVSYDSVSSASIKIERTNDLVPIVEASTAYDVVKLPLNTAAVRMRLVSGTTVLDQQEVVLLTASASEIALTQEKVFNAITNDGVAQGLFLDNGNLYINASYIGAGAINIGKNVTVNGVTQWQRTFYANTANGYVEINADSLKIQGSNVSDVAASQAALLAEDSILNDVDSQDKLFTAITGGDANQGIFLENGKLYINSSYIKTGTLVVGGANNANGTIRVNNASGTLIGGINNTEIYHKHTNNDKISMNSGGLYFYKNTSTRVGEIRRDGNDLYIGGASGLSIQAGGDISLFCYDNSQTYNGINIVKSNTTPVSVGNGATEWYVEIPTSINLDGTVASWASLRLSGGIIYNR